MLRSIFIEQKANGAKCEMWFEYFFCVLCFVSSNPWYKNQIRMWHNKSLLSLKPFRNLLEFYLQSFEMEHNAYISSFSADKYTSCHCKFLGENMTNEKHLERFMIFLVHSPFNVYRSAQKINKNRNAIIYHRLGVQRLRAKNHICL